MKKCNVRRLSGLAFVLVACSLSVTAHAKPTQCFSMKDGTELNARIKNDTKEHLKCEIECSYLAVNGNEMLYECESNVPAESEEVACSWPLTKLLTVEKIVKSVSRCEVSEPDKKD